MIQHLVVSHVVILINLAIVSRILKIDVHLVCIFVWPARMGSIVLLVRPAVVWRQTRCACA